MAKTSSEKLKYSRTIDNNAMAFDEWAKDTKVFFLHPDDIGCDTTLASRNNDTKKTYFNGHLVLAKHGETVILRSLTALLLNGYFALSERRPQRKHNATKALGAFQASVFMPANINRVSVIVNDIYEGRGKWSVKSDEGDIIALGLDYIEESYQIDGDNIVVDGVKFPIADIQQYVADIKAKADADAAAWDAENE